MKKLLPILIITAAFNVIAATSPNVLLIDSSFAPVNLTHSGQTPDKCLLISESNSTLPTQGDCYDRVSWRRYSKSEVEYLKGLQDQLAGVSKSEASKKWARFNKSSPQKAKALRNKYIVATHGSRSAYILDKFGGGKADILYMRNMTTGIGGGTFSKNIKRSYPRYSNGCGLINWSSSDIQKYNSGALQPYQQTISTTLTKNKEIKIVNLSLGYKENWIGEDNPRCNKDQVRKEFEVLIRTWSNTILRHSNVLFIVAAGNENENFNNPKFSNNDLWSYLASQNIPNLLLVGSTYENGTKFSSSNYGKVVEVMALGNNILLNSPTPGEIRGHQTTVRGTSFTTPYISGAAAQFLLKTKGTRELKRKLVDLFFNDRKEKVKNTFVKACAKTESMDCLQSIITVLSGPYMWGDTHKLFALGKERFNYAPFPIEYKKGLGAQAKVQLIDYKGQYLPTLLLGEADSPYDLLLTLHHEIHHYAQMKESMKYFRESERIAGCTTRYRIEMLKDEPRAFLKELEFYESSPDWFKKGADTIKFNSKLLGLKNVTYTHYYNALRRAITSDKNFISDRYIELGEYPPCIKKLLKK